MGSRWGHKGCTGVVGRLWGSSLGILYSRGHFEKHPFINFMAVSGDARLSGRSECGMRATRCAMHRH